MNLSTEDESNAEKRGDTDQGQCRQTTPPDLTLESTPELTPKKKKQGKKKAISVTTTTTTHMKFETPPEFMKDKSGFKQWKDDIIRWDLVTSVNPLER